MRYVLTHTFFLIATTLQSTNGKCSTSEDCSLNGDCTNAECVCDPAWTGAACDVLAFKAADKLGGYHNKVCQGGNMVQRGAGSGNERDVGCVWLRQLG